MRRISDVQRRGLLRAASAALGLAAIDPRAAWAALTRTPAQARGPFYPLQLPLDRDNDLVRVDDAATPARGVVTHVGGRVIDVDGNPQSDVQIEIWQCNAYGRYHHPRDDSPAPLDPGFQGFGQTVTSADGAYRFRTIKPVPYPGRAPHIHFHLHGRHIAPLTTQMYVAGAPENAGDFLLRAVTDSAQRARIVINLIAAPQAGELVANFDLVVARR